MPSPMDGGGNEMTVNGIYNQGNSCFLNALLQAMSSCARLNKFFENIDELLEQEAVFLGSEPAVQQPQQQQSYFFFSIARQQQEEHLSRAIGNAMQQLQPQRAAQKRSNKPINLALLQKRVQALFPAQQSFVGDDQQDADEVLLLMLDLVEKEYKSAWRTLAPKLSLQCEGMSLVLSDPWWNVQRNHKPAITTQQPIRGRIPLQSPLLGSSFLLLQCTNCGRKSPLKPDPFSVLSLCPVGTTLEECLQNFSQREEIDGYECEHCRRKVRAIKRDVIGKLPQVLCIKLMRNEFVHGRMVKNRQIVALPDVLDLKPVCFYHVLSSSPSVKTTQPPSPWKQTLKSSSRQPITSHVLGALGGTLPTNAGPPNLAENTPTEYRLMAVVSFI